MLTYIPSTEVTRLNNRVRMIERIQRVTTGYTFGFLLKFEYKDLCKFWARLEEAETHNATEPATIDVNSMQDMVERVEE